MVHSTPIALTAATLLLLPPALADGLYSKTSPVLQVSGSTYDHLIAKSNHTSILEFYAPWCGHCQNLKPAYEKAAKSLAGLAKVAAVNCDEETNKQFCGSMGVQGFPTLKIIKPGKKTGKPIVEDYVGARSAKAVVDAVVDKIPNHVKRLKDDDYQDWLEDGDGPKAILFSDKGTTSALLKSIAIDFLGAINVAQIRDKEKEAVEVFNVDKFPTLVLLPGDSKDPITYDGEMKKEALVRFLSKAADPNPDPPVKAAKGGSKSDKKKGSKDSSSFSKASASQAEAEAKTGGKASQTLETMEDSSQPTESPDPNIVTDDTELPIKVPDIAPPISTLADAVSLQQKCLNTKAGTCILALLPEESEASPETLKAVSILSEIHHKHESAKRNLFPFFQLPSTNPQTTELRSKLQLPQPGVELVALNGKRAWYRHYSKATVSLAEVEDWIDSIRMGDGFKGKVPEGLIVDADEVPAEEPIKSDKLNPEAIKEALRNPDAIEEALRDPEYIKKALRDPAIKEALRSPAIKEALKDRVPEGVDFDFEELDDDAYERLIEQASANAKKRKEEELANESGSAKAEEPIEHIEL